MAEVENDGGFAGETGAGDEIRSLNSKKNVMEEDKNDDDPERIVSLGFEEISLSEKGKQQSSVYNPCTVDSQSQEFNAMKEVMRELNQQEQSKGEVRESTWSITKFISGGWFRFKCCDKGDLEEDNGQNMELDSLCAAESKGAEAVDEVDGSDEKIEDFASCSKVRIELLPICSMGPVMTVDCSKFSLDEELKRLKTYLGDPIRKLIIKNRPIKTAIKIVNEPLLCESVTMLHIENCDVSVRDLCLILGSLKYVEQLGLIIRNMGKDGTLLLRDDFYNSRGIQDYFTTQRDCLFESVKSLEFPQRLKRLTVSVPMTWQCHIICRTVEAMLGESQLQEINLKSSLKEMIDYLVSTNGISFDEEKTWQDEITLGARDLIEKSRSSLKDLSISCADNFPLEHLKISKCRGVSIKDIYQWCFYCTYGVLSTIAAFDGGDKNPHLLLPVLTNLHLDLPIIPVILAREDYFRKPLNAIAEFLARNNGIHVVKLLGLRPEKGMENWVRNSLVSIPKYRMNIGCTYTSTTLAGNLPVFDDELGSLGLEIVADETRRRVANIIEPSGMEVVPLTWRYTGMKTFHLVNQLPSLISYDLDRIALKFNKLTKLVIEDFAVSQSSYDENNGVMIRTLDDIDMQTIFQQLVLLEYLHLDCNMKNMTDRGITGITDSLWSRLTQKNKMFSFWYLTYLKYVFLKGFGMKVTDKSAIHAFSEDFSLKNLQELHIFAPGFTNYGREKIRRTYAMRNSFVLQLPEVE